MNQSQTLSVREGQRKLASIQQVTQLSPIKNADKIELATIEGWKAIVTKGDFSVGDKGVYFEIDSFLPLEARYQFLAKSSKKENPYTHTMGYRIRTRKMRNQISQGLLMPLKAFPELDGTDAVGTDVTLKLGVEKYYVPEIKGNFGLRKGDFPIQFTEKTDEQRLQSHLDYLQEFANQEYYISTKIDGTSLTLIKHHNEIRMASRNEEIDINNSWIYDLFVLQTGLEQKLQQLPYADVVLQGEFYGEKIAKNRLGIKGNKWAVFTVQVNYQRVGLIKALNISQQLGLTFVPIEEVGTQDQHKINQLIALGINSQQIKKQPFDYSLNDLLKKAEGFYPNGSKKEGIVVRELNDTKNDRHNVAAGHFLSFKVLNNQYLLKNKD